MLCWDLLKECVLFLRRAAPEVQISLSTNGSLLTLPRYRFLRQHRVLIRLSCDGISSVQNAHRRSYEGEGTAEDVISRIRRIPVLERRDLSVNMVICPDTIPFLVDGCAFFSSQKIGGINFFPDLHGHLWDERAVKAFEKSMMDFADFYVGSFGKKDKMIPLKVGWLWHFLHNKKVVVLGRECREDRMEGCSSVWLGPEGNFYICERAPLSKRSERASWQAGDVRKGLDMARRASLLARVGRQVRRELGSLGVDGAECFLCPFSFCLGAGSSRVRNKRLKFYQDILQIYARTGSRIQDSLRTNPEFRRLYR